MSFEFVRASQLGQQARSSSAGGGSGIRPIVLKPVVPPSSPSQPRAFEIELPKRRSGLQSSEDGPYGGGIGDETPRTRAVIEAQLLQTPRTAFARLQAELDAIRAEENAQLDQEEREAAEAERQLIAAEQEAMKKSSSGSGSTISPRPLTTVMRASTQGTSAPVVPKPVVLVGSPPPLVVKLPPPLVLKPPPTRHLAGITAVVKALPPPPPVTTVPMGTPPLTLMPTPSPAPSNKSGLEEPPICTLPESSGNKAEQEEEPRSASSSTISSLHASPEDSRPGSSDAPPLTTPSPPPPSLQQSYPEDSAIISPRRPTSSSVAPSTPIDEDRAPLNAQIDTVLCLANGRICRQGWCCWKTHGCAGRRESEIGGGGGSTLSRSSTTTTTGNLSTSPSPLSFLSPRGAAAPAPADIQYHHRRTEELNSTSEKIQMEYAAALAFLEAYAPVTSAPRSSDELLVNVDDYVRSGLKTHPNWPRGSPPLKKRQHNLTLKKYLEDERNRETLAVSHGALIAAGLYLGVIHPCDLEDPKFNGPSLPVYVCRDACLDSNSSSSSYDPHMPKPMIKAETMGSITPGRGSSSGSSGGGGKPSKPSLLSRIFSSKKLAPE